jgi:hypothetical protein
MPIEYGLLKNAPVPLQACPKCCYRPFEPFLRGLVQRSPIGWRWAWPPWFQRPYCALICWACKEIVGWE